MKQVLTGFLIIALIGLLALSFQQKSVQSFYYAFDEKIELIHSKDKLIVLFMKDSILNKERLMTEYPILNSYAFVIRDNNTVIVHNLKAETKKNLIESIKTNQDIIVNPVYETAEGAELGFTDKFIVELKPGFSKRELEKLNIKNNVKVFKETEDFFVLRVSKDVDVLEIANSYFETGKFIFSHPDFYMNIELNQVSNDPYFTNQFYLHNTGQVIADGRFGTPDADIDAPEAWTVTTGSSNITVAVIDTGVSPNHVDLPNSRQVRLNGSNFTNHGTKNNPSPGGTYRGAAHGDAVSGIIAATRNNGIGITGVAPGVKIMPIRIINGDGFITSNANLADAIDFARINNADVINCSWTFPGFTNPNHVPAIVRAIERATISGRNGLGSVVVFGAGNNANHVNNLPGTITFPANVTVPGVFAVGASDRYDMQANYSPSSNFTTSENQFIDIVAPSSRAIHTQIPGETNEVFTIDMPGNPGYNPVKSNQSLGPLAPTGSLLPSTGPNHLDFTGRFGGTSAAAPQVAGAAALVLSVNPGLTQMDVFNILTQTADKVGGYTYNHNGRSTQLGFGRLNVCRAVTAAAVINGPSLICSTGQFFMGSSLPTGSILNAWQSSNPSGLSINSSTGSATRLNNYNGPITITANITNGCGTASASRTIWVGTPHITNMRVNNQPVWPSQNVPLCPGNHFLNVTPVGGNVGTATWTVPSGVTHWIGNNTMDFTFPSHMSSITISARASNFCGQGANYNFFLTRQTWGCPSSFAMVAYPNPTSDILNIEMMPVTADVSKEDAPAIESALLLNSEGREMAKGYREGSKIVFDVRSLKKGIYFIHVTVDGEIIREQILIE
ncbi:MULTISPECIES: S8 family serine peptidase [Cecembia]|uniref:Putative secreted protein (Por secretion system target) n=2 Tax=Cecembia TaxID=1187078 RepID=A0A4Q7P8F9_9BACT|nr:MULTISPECIES: S8 family serine peptidase [Cecembia]PSL04834.1 putative secreted protein (Por secretion system target) [Cecembia rubra]RZS96466.1 putative secreted protein (Por secretion system target) [Cecembia calidifontis]